MSSRKEFNFRVTGSQSTERLTPLIENFINAQGFTPITNLAKNFDFVWETYCERTMRDKHRSATVWNKLHNTCVLESKSNQAFLELTVSCPYLETFIAPNATCVRAWCNQRWMMSPSSSGALAPDQYHQRTQNDDCWWVLKASNGNGGQEIWLLNRENFVSVVSTIKEEDEYVIQKYIMKPKLLNGKKFHFRCYALLCADFSAYLYQEGFILSASLDYDLKTDAMCAHITNLSVNTRQDSHPGRIPCDLHAEFPVIFANIQTIWREMTTAAQPYMQYQSSNRHFEFFGIDIIADESDCCYLIESNRHPGLENSRSSSTAQEDRLCNDMLTELLALVLQFPLEEKEEKEEEEKEVVAVVAAKRTEDGAINADALPPPPPPRPCVSKSKGTAMHPRWHKVKESSTVDLLNRHEEGPQTQQHEPTSTQEARQEHQQQRCGPEFAASCWRNTMNWKAYTRRSRSKLVVPQSPVVEAESTTTS